MYRWVLQSLALLAAIAALAASGGEKKSVTFEKDVLPILQKRCQTCHRPGEIGPMPLQSYDQVRPWAKAIEEIAVLKRMPPWFADPQHGRFRNDRSLTQGEIDTLAAWARAGAPRGDPSGAAVAPEFVEGWRIGEPDVIIELPKDFHVPATGTIDYQWITIPSGFTQDRWVKAVEIRPGNPAVLHHAVAYSRRPDSTYARDYPNGEFFEYIKDLIKRPKRVDRTMLTPLDEPNLLEAFVPGAEPVAFPPGQARLIKAGSDIMFQLHYTTTGKPATDRTRIGLIFALEQVKEEIKNIAVINGKNFAIPPGESRFQVVSRVEVIKPLRVVAMLPHMHFRGKSFEYRETYPDGSSEVLLRVPKYNFHWQLSYYLAEPKQLPVGTILTCTAVYDNSSNNPDNPDPSATVHSGLQSWDEMMSGHMDIGVAPGEGGQAFFRDAPADR